MLAFDEVGGDVERDRHPVLDQHRQRDLGEVGGAVVEGDRHHRLPRRVRVGEASQPVGEGHDGRLGGEERHLLGEEGPGKVDLDRRPAPDPVVDEDHQPGRGRAHGVDHRRRDLQRRPGGAHRAEARAGVRSGVTASASGRLLHREGDVEPRRGPTASPARSAGLRGRPVDIAEQPAVGAAFRMVTRARAVARHHDRVRAS